MGRGSRKTNILGGIARKEGLWQFACLRVGLAIKRGAFLRGIDTPNAHYEPLLEDEIFEATCLYQISNSKTQNQHAHFLRFLFTEDYLQIKRGLKLVSRPHFSQNFSINIFLQQYYINWPNFITRPCLLSKLFSKIGFMFHACVFDDVT